MTSKLSKNKNKLKKNDIDVKKVTLYNKVPYVTFD